MIYDEAEEEEEEEEEIVLTSELPNMATNLVGSTWQLRR